MRNSIKYQVDGHPHHKLMAFASTERRILVFGDQFDPTALL